MTFTGASSGELAIFDCSGIFIEAIESSSPAILSPVPSDGEYYIVFALLHSVDFSSAFFEITSSDTLTVNPVIALWDDSGTTRQLWACPKLLLPPLTEDTGTWYADETAAQDAIDDQTSNCVGYSDYLNSPTTFTATDGGTSLTLAETYTVPVFTSDGLWGGVNAEEGETLTFTSTVGVGTANVAWSIYDDTGALVESSGGIVASPSTSSALPYTGRYTGEVVGNSSLVTTSLSVAITSSGTLTVNTIQALFDFSLTCPSRLDCS